MKTISKALLIGVLSVAFSWGLQYGTMKDPRDGKVYKTVAVKVRIGDDSYASMNWMAENLDYKMKGSEFFEKKYGRYYNFESAQKVCPSGWGLPAGIDYMYLLTAVGATVDCDDNKCRSEIPDGRRAEVSNGLRSKTGWDSYLANKGNDKIGFNALPAGGGVGEGEFQNVGSVAAFWTSFQANPGIGRIFLIKDGDVFLNDVPDDMYFPVRCVKLEE